MAFNGPDKSFGKHSALKRARSEIRTFYYLQRAIEGGFFRIVVRFDKDLLRAHSLIFVTYPMHVIANTAITRWWTQARTMGRLSSPSGIRSMRGPRTNERDSSRGSYFPQKE